MARKAREFSKPQKMYGDQELVSVQLEKKMEMVGPYTAKNGNIYTCIPPKVSVMKARWTSQDRKTQERMERKPGQRNTGHRDELESGGSCCTRQTRMATFGL